MRSVNKIILVGNATRAAELRHTKTDKPVSNIRLATNRTVNGTETTQYHTVVCWDALAETTGAYVKKGDLLYVEGRLEYRTFTDEEGTERGAVEIIASDVQFLSGRKDAPADAPAAAPAGSDQDSDELRLDDLPL